MIISALVRLRLSGKLFVDLQHVSYTWCSTAYFKSTYVWHWNTLALKQQCCSFSEYPCCVKSCESNWQKKWEVLPNSADNILEFQTHFGSPDVLYSPGSSLYFWCERKLKAELPGFDLIMKVVMVTDVEVELRGSVLPFHSAQDVLSPSLWMKLAPYSSFSNHHDEVPCHHPLQVDPEGQQNQGDQPDLGFHHDQRDPWDLSPPGCDRQTCRSVSLRPVWATFTCWRKCDTHRATLFSCRARRSLGAVATCQTNWTSRAGSTSLTRWPLTPENKDPSVIAEICVRSWFCTAEGVSRLCWSEET